MDIVQVFLLIGSIWSVIIWYGPLVFPFIKSVSKKFNDLKDFLALPRPPKLKREYVKQMTSYAEEIGNLDDGTKDILNQMVVDWENDEIFDTKGCIDQIFALYEDIITIMEKSVLSDREKLKKTAFKKETIKDLKKLLQQRLRQL